MQPEREEFLALQSVIGNEEVDNPLLQGFVHARCRHHRLSRLSIERNGDDAIVSLVPALLSLLAFQNADDLSEYDTADRGGFFADQQHIQRIAVSAYRGWEETEIERE